MPCLPSVENKRVTLQDGRVLGYAKYGDRAGRLVLYFAGSPSSRLLHPPEAATSSLGARVIVIERPGLGLSDFQRGRRLLDWPEDVRQLADAVGMDRFPVVGVSGGAPYAAVCAYRIPVRLWHGEEETNVSVSAARHMARAIPGCQSTFLAGQGHWLIIEHWEEIRR
jgi:pimeloyl-ACP methyl ester carboxylesterase